MDLFATITLTNIVLFVTFGILIRLYISSLSDVEKLNFDKDHNGLLLIIGVWVILTIIEIAAYLIYLIW